MVFDDPETVAELTAVFERYEHALVHNDVDILGELFLDGPSTIRYGIGENLYGSEEIAAFRRVRPSAGLDRRLARTVISTYGRDTATVSTLFYRDSAPGTVGRQMQTWVRTADGWRVAAAHVSIINEPD